MKNNWKIKKLGEVCDIKTGKKDVNQGNLNGKYPFFTCAREHTYSDEYSFDMEAILVAGNGDVGHVSYYKGKFEAYQRTYVLFNFKDISVPFLLHFLEGMLKDTVSKQKLGNTMPYIKMGMLENFEIPLPSSQEQKRIVKVLDEVFDKVEKSKKNAKKNLQNAKEIFESYLQSVFSNEKWEEDNLSDVCDVEYGYTEKARCKGDYRFVRITDTDKNGLLTQEKKMYINSFKESNKYILKDGDLLMARTGASAGNVLLFKGEEKAVFASYLIRMKFKKEISSKLYWYFSKSRLYWDQVSQLSAGSAQPQFNGGALKQIVFKFPKSITEQKSIVAKLDALSAETKKLETIYNHKLANLEEFKKSILQKAFEGKL
ncbi:MAG: restriction endonuclease subunit S [bacterium]|nr:restriction endonuclease subunit S [bacterium]